MRRKKKLSVGIGTIKESLDRFESVWKHAARGERVTPEYRLTFSSLPQLLKELTPARWALLEALRAALMIEVQRYVNEGGLTQIQAAKRLGITQPRLNDLLRGKIDKFSVDARVNMLAKADKRVSVKVRKAA